MSFSCCSRSYVVYLLRLILTYIENFVYCLYASISCMNSSLVLVQRKKIVNWRRIQNLVRTANVWKSKHTTNITHFVCHLILESHNTFSLIIFRSILGQIICLVPKSFSQWLLLRKYILIFTRTTFAGIFEVVFH